MKVGDLVQVRNYSSPKNKYSDRLAIILRYHQVRTRGRWDFCDIVFADTNEQIDVNISNLELISEGR